MRRLRADIAVVGGGPAGAVFAARTAALGFDVCVVEKARFPRRHLGESLSPGVAPMLAAAGLAGALARAGFLRVHDVSTNWDGAEAVRHDPRAQGLLVDRAAFDAALLEEAAWAGARVLQPARARGQVRTAEGWRLEIEAGDGPVELDAAFLADASGRAAWLGGGRAAMGPRTLAVHRYWTGRRLPARPRIEAGARAWSWGVPLPGGCYDTLVFVDAAAFRGDGGPSLDERLRALLDASALLRGVEGAAPLGPAQAADATPYLYDDCAGERHVRIGDAALALDPLSSSGVQKAIQTALSAAIVANTLLRRPEAGAAARRYHEDNLRDAAVRHRAWAAGHYATAAAHREDAFWSERARPPDDVAPERPPSPRRPPPDDVPLRLSADCRWAELPCLGARFVELKQALHHPGIEGPVAFVGGHELAPLLGALPAGRTSGQLAAAWASAVPVDKGLSIARWLAARGVLEPAEPSQRSD